MPADEASLRDTDPLVGVGDRMADQLGAAQGELYVPETDMATLLGRPVTPLTSALRAQLATA